MTRAGPEHRWKPVRVRRQKAGIILCMRPVNKKRRYNVTSFLIGWAYTQNGPSITGPHVSPEGPPGWDSQDLWCHRQLILHHPLRSWCYSPAVYKETDSFLTPQTIYNLFYQELLSFEYIRNMFCGPETMTAKGKREWWGLQSKHWSLTKMDVFLQDTFFKCVLNWNECFDSIFFPVGPIDNK